MQQAEAIKFGRQLFAVECRVSEAYRNSRTRIVTARESRSCLVA